MRFFYSNVLINEELIIFQKNFIFKIMKKILILNCALLYIALSISCNQSAENKNTNIKGSDSTFRLGSAAQITIATNDIDKSKVFYELLGFKQVQEIPSGIQMSDESVLIMLQKSDNKFIRISYFDSNADKIADEVEKQGNHFIVKNENTGFFTRSIFSTPDGIEVSLVKMDPSNIYKPKGKNGMNMSDAERKDAKNYPNAMCGAFGELSIPVANFDSSYAYWKKLGFNGTKYTEPYPWAVMTDGFLSIGLHQQTQFTYQAITFFAPDMQQRIDKLISLGLTVTEFMAPGNGVVVSPEGTHIFLFGM